MNSRIKYAVCIGGANFDIHTQINQSIVMRDSNPGHVFTSSGGVARNIAENLARQGVDCSLLTMIGQDAFGNGILRDCQSVGIDTSLVKISDEYPTSCYIDMLDETGDMFIASSDMGILEHMPADYLKKNRDLISNATAVVLDTNIEAEHFEAVIEVAGNAPLFVDPVSTTKSKRLKPYIGSLFFIKPNLIELETISETRCRSDADIRRASDKLLNSGLKSLAVSLGSRGCFYADAKGNAIFFPVLKNAPVVNATGAGDSFVAGFVHAYMEQMPLEYALSYATACGQLATMSIETINPVITDSYIRQYIEECRTQA